MTTTQLRLFTIDHGRLEDFADAWLSGVYPLRTAQGYRIELAGMISGWLGTSRRGPRSAGPAVPTPTPFYLGELVRRIRGYGLLREPMRMSDGSSGRRSTFFVFLSLTALFLVVALAAALGGFWQGAAGAMLLAAILFMMIWSEETDRAVPPRVLVGLSLLVLGVAGSAALAARGSGALLALPIGAFVSGLAYSAWSIREALRASRTQL